jgi:hypothetical protein
VSARATLEEAANPGFDTDPVEIQTQMIDERQYPAEVPSVFTMQLSIPRFAS